MPCPGSKSLSSRAITSPIRAPVTASTPIRAWIVAVRSGVRSRLAWAISAAMSAAEYR